jgi:nucleoside diphosphate kinase
MVLVYEGENAVEKIRNVLGPTDPTKAPGGTVRREFGSNIMVNTAHASDSPESAEREMKILGIEENNCAIVMMDYLKLMGMENSQPQ